MIGRVNYPTDPNKKKTESNLNDINSELARRLPLSGGTITGDLILQSGSSVHKAIADTNNEIIAGLFKIAQIVIKSTSVDVPIIFELIHRGAKQPMIVSIKFENTSSSIDPELEHIIYYGENYGAYIYKSSRSTWDLYIKKSEAQDSITVTQLQKDQSWSNDIVEVIWKDDVVSTKPEDSIEATLHYISSTSIESNNLDITELNNIAILNYIKSNYREMNNYIFKGTNCTQSPLNNETNSFIYTVSTINDSRYLRVIAYDTLENKSYSNALIEDNWTGWNCILDQKNYMEYIDLSEIGALSQETFNNFQIGGRNLARGTSSTYTEITHNTEINTSSQLARVYTNGLKVGDIVTVRLLYKYTNLISSELEECKIGLQGAGNITGLNDGAFNSSEFINLTGSGEHEFLYSFEITQAHLENEYWIVEIRHDNITSGTSAWKMFKVERGTKASDWTPAPEDLALAQHTHYPSDVIQDSENRFVSDEKISNWDDHLSNTSNPHNITTEQIGAVPISEKGIANGIATLDSTGKVPSTQLPSYVDDILEYDDESQFPEVGESGKLYLDTTTGKIYRWAGTTYAIIPDSLTLGETENTAYRGDRGKIAYEHTLNTSNPHNVTTEQIGALKQEDFDNFEIGCRNLIRNSSFLNGTKYWYLHSYSSLDNTKTLNNNPSIKIDVSGKINNSWTGCIYRLSNNNVILEKGKVYTLSCYYYSEDISSIDNGIGLVLKGIKSGDSNYIDIGGNITKDIIEGKWSRITTTISIDDEYTDCYIYAYVTCNGQIWFTNFKLEQSSKASDWTPDPEDLALVQHTHSPSDIIQDSENRFVSDEKINSWDDHLINENNPHNVTTEQIGAIPISQKGVANGVATLDSTGKIPSTQLPSYVDDILEYDNESLFPEVGESGKIYTDISTGKIYRWSGSTYTIISDTLALGETENTAYRGDRGKIAYDHTLDVSNPHNVTTEQIGALSKEDFDNFQIGGRNLLTNTVTFTGWRKADTSSVENTYNGFALYENTYVNNGTYNDLGLDNIIDIEPNTTYVLSFWAKGEGNIRSFFYPNIIEKTEHCNGTIAYSDDGNILTTLTDQWTRYWIRWTTKYNASGLKSIIVCRQQTEGTVSIYAPKLEKGTKVSDWTPAPEDILYKSNIVNDLTTTLDGYVLDARVAKTLDDKKLDKTGGTISGNLVLKKGFIVSNTNQDGAGSAGYMKVATINISATHMNSPINFVISRRNSAQLTNVFIGFKNASNTDPELNYFTYYGSDIGVYIHKSATSTWDLYIKKSESYDNISIHDIKYNSGYMKGINITTSSVFTSSLPDGYVSVTFALNASYASSSGKWSVERNVAINGDYQGSFSLDGSKDISFNLHNKYSIAVVKNSTNYIYHRIAKLDKVSKTHRDDAVVIKITQDYCNRFALFRVRVRRNGTGQNSVCVIQWITSVGYKEDDLCVGFSNEHDNTYADIFLKVREQYDNAIISIFSSSYREDVGSNWILINSSESNNTTSTDKLDSYECWSSVEEAATELHGEAYNEIKIATSAGSVNFSNHSRILSLLSDPRPADANVDFSTFTQRGITTMLASSNMTSNKPYADGIIMNLGWDWGNYGAQLYINTDSTKHTSSIQYRKSGETINNWSRWKTLLDDENFAEFITPDSIKALSQESFNNFQIGGRNLAIGTSKSYRSEFKHNGGTNICVRIAKVYNEGLKLGDTITVRLLYKYTDIVSESSGTARVRIQGMGDVSGWSNGAFNSSEFVNISGSGEYEFLYSFKITQAQLENGYWDVQLRHDYFATGTSTWKMFKVERATKSSDWTPAPEDLALSSHSHTASDIIQDSDNRFVTDTDKSNWNNHVTNKSNPHGVTVSQIGAISTSEKGKANGVATLDSTGKVPSTQLPSYVDDILEYSNMSSFPSTGESGKIYTDISTGKIYRWSGSTYTIISDTLALGETSSTAYRGDRGKIAYDHTNNKSNPHGVTIEQIGAASASHTHNYLPLSGGTMTGNINTSYVTESFLNGNKGKALINSLSAAGLYTTLHRYQSTNGFFTISGYLSTYRLQYTSKTTVNANTNAVDKSAILLDESGNSSFPGTVSASSFSGSLSGNASSASKVNNGLTISLNGASQGAYDGSAAKSINITPSSIGASATSHNHDINGLTNKGATIDASFATAYRTQTKGNTSAGDYIRVLRNDTASVANSPQYGSGIGWGRADTHGYMYMSYNSAEMYVGAGNTDKLNWVKKVSLDGHTHSYLPLSGGTITGIISTSFSTNNHLLGNTTGSLINSTASAGSYVMLHKYPSTNGYFTLGGWTNSYRLFYTAKSTVDAGTNSYSKMAILLNESGNSSFPGTVSASSFSGSLSGNASSASKVNNALTISLNGTSQGAYDGSAAKSINITPSSIGAAASSHTHSPSNIVQDANNRFVTDTEKSTWNSKAAGNHTHNYAGSSSAGGSANSAIKLATARTINGVSFDGTANISVPNNTYTKLTTGSLDNVKTLGNYYADSHSVTNLPGSSGETFTLIVAKHYSNGIMQLYYSGSTIALRVFKDDAPAWSSWIEMATYNTNAYSRLGAAAASHTHTKSQITDFPSSIKNPNAITISLNGTSQGAYDGSAAKSINITPSSIGAAASSHTHSYLPLSGGTVSGNVTVTGDITTNGSNLYLGTNYSGQKKIYFYSYPTTTSGNKATHQTRLYGGAPDSDTAFGLYDAYGGSVVFAYEDGNTSSGTTGGSKKFKINSSVTFSATGSISSSDEKLKHDFGTLEKYEEWYYDLEPCTFKYNNGNSGRTWIGLGARKTKQKLLEHGLSLKEFAGITIENKSPDSDDWRGVSDEHGIRYEQFIMLNTHMIQKHKKEIDSLNNKLQEQNKQIEKQNEQLQSQQKEIDELKEAVELLMKELKK